MSIKELVIGKIRSVIGQSQTYQILYRVGPLQAVCYNDTVHSCVSIQFDSMSVAIIEF